LADRPVESKTDDLLGFTDYAETLVTLIRGLDPGASLTIGVFGDWGSGKTTLLHLIDESLRGGPVATVWVNVWQLGSEEALWNAFLQAVLNKVRDEMPIGRRLAFNARLLRRRVDWPALPRQIVLYGWRALVAAAPVALARLIPAEEDSQAAILAGGGLASAALGLYLVARPFIEAMRQGVSIDLGGLIKATPYQQRISQLDQFKAHFNDMVQVLIGRDGRLAVIIDDLDRCPPERLVGVLDALKVFVDSPGTAYVLGLDRGIIEQAVQKKYQDYADPAGEAREYLEKIVQLPFDLPPLTGEQMETFVGKTALGLPDPRCNGVFALGLEPNLRKVKRTIYTYLLFWQLAQQKKLGEIKPVRLAKIVVIQHSYPGFYALVRNFPADLARLEAYFAAARGEAAEKEFQADMEGLVEGARQKIRRVFESDEYAAKKEEIVQGLQKQRQELLSQMGEKSQEEGFLLQMSGEMGLLIIPVIEGLALSEEEFQALSPEVKEDMLKRRESLQEELKRAMRQVRGLEKKANEALQELDQEVALYALSPLVEDLKEKYQDIPEVVTYLAQVQGDILGNLSRFREEPETKPSTPVSMPGAEELRFRTLAELMAPARLESFRDNSGLRRLLSLHLDEAEAEDANFADLSRDEIRAYITLTRTVRAAVPEAALPREAYEPELVHVPAGPFLMGTSDEEIQWLLENTDWAGLFKRAEGFKRAGWFDREQPAHDVDLPEYWIGRYPVTNAEYAAFVQAVGLSPPRHWEGGEYPAELSDHPVVNVSWHDAVAYCQWLSEVTGKPYHLPSEAEWEKAASWDEQAGKRLRYPWGDEFDPKKCNTGEGAAGETTPVGQYSPDGDSPYGAGDMAGNVWEWCQDWFAKDYYQRSPPENPSGSEQGEVRVLRGGSWDLNQFFARCAYRHRNYPDYRHSLIGFRVAASPGSP
jgi:formylglycine-generating enzyme required for sulfatase activity